MFSKKRTRIFFIMILALSLFVNLLGIKWGLPGSNIINLVFGDIEFHKTVLSQMVETRDEIRQMIKVPGDKYYSSYDENRMIKIPYKNEMISLTVGQVNAMRTYLLRTYYPDEHITIAALANINVKEKKFSPKVLIPGPLYVYISGLWLKICDFFNVVKISKNVDFYLNNPSKMASIYVSLRILLIIILCLTVYFTFHSISAIWGVEAGIISSLLVGISPVLNLWNHFGYYYGFALPFVILAFYYGYKILRDNRLRFYIVSAVLSAISMSVVMLYGISIWFLISAILVILIYSERTRKTLNTMIKNFLVASIVFAGTFVFIHIFLLIDKETLVKLMNFEHGDFKFSPQFFYFTFASLKSACGWPFLISAIAGYVLLITRFREKNAKFFVISLVLPFIVFSCFSPWYARRSIFLIPFMAMSAGVFLIWLKNKNRVIGNIILIFTVVFTLLYSVSYTKIFVEKNIRDIAGEWINENIPEKAKIGLSQLPAPYRTPPFQFYRYSLLPVNWDKDLLKKERPEYFIVSEYDVLWQTKEKLDQFFSDYDVLKSFRKQAQICGISFNRTSFSAKDFWVPNPDIVIYKRKNVEK